MSNEIEKLVQCLQDLSNNTYSTPTLARQSNAKTEKLLNLIFQLGTENVRFTAEQSKTIGPLLVPAIEPIQINIERACCIHRTRLNTSILRKRSALQFLVTDYGSFPTIDTILSNVLSQSNIQETIQILDEVIEKWRDVSDSDEGETDRETSGIPTSHYWWSQ